MIQIRFNFPDGLNEGKKYPVVVEHSGGGVKEQTAGLYVRKMVANGFVIIAFDAFDQGESIDELRRIEDPDILTEDISVVVDYLCQHFAEDTVCH
ncbi:MAG TPA: alpha/beta hydrolase [Nitrospira sp.]|nr:alpha/beta hydrolase [Nitrospira sp.]